MPENRIDGGGATPGGAAKFAPDYGVVVRNAGVNIAGRILPAVTVAATLPFIIHRLGDERYGILSFALVMVTYFSLFDLGLGGATTRFVAAALGAGEDESLPVIVWTSQVVVAALGLVACLAMFLLAAPLAGHFLRISPGLRGDAVVSFEVMAVAAPFMLTASVWRGVLEASQRYDLVNAVSVPSNVATYLFPVFALLAHWGLPAIVALIVLVRGLACLAYAWAGLSLHPAIRRAFRVNFTETRPLLLFGGWLALSNLAWPVLLCADRFVIGFMLPVALLTYYAAPCDIVTRLWALPASWAALYPAFSAAAEGRQDLLAQLCARGAKHLAMLLGPLVVVGIVFAGKIMGTWLGAEFAVRSSVVFQFLAAGVLVNSLANVPDWLIKGLGRSDIVAKLHLAEIPLYGTLLYLFISQWGIAGAAAAWGLRAFVEAVVVYGIALKFVPAIGPAVIKAGFLRVVFWLAGLAGVLWSLSRLLQGLPLAVAVAVSVAGFCGVSWLGVLDSADRAWVLSLATRAKRLEVEA